MATFLRTGIPSALLDWQGHAYHTSFVCHLFLWINLSSSTACVHAGAPEAGAPKAPVKRGSPRARSND